jgi:uncharacterized protein YndB with AHSA1/START domain
MGAGERGEAAVNQTTLERTSDSEIVIRRTFNGPPRIVFDAWTRPALVERWWAPASRGVTVVSCQADVREGGAWRYVLHHQAHGELPFSGTYREVTPPSRLVYTEIFEPGRTAPDEGGHAVVTVTFDERDGKTDVTSRSRFPSKAVLEMVLASGMESGMRETMDQLDALVASLDVPVAPGITGTTT